MHTPFVVLNFVGPVVELEPARTLQLVANVRTFRITVGRLEIFRFQLVTIEEREVPMTDTRASLCVKLRTLERFAPRAPVPFRNIET